MLFGNSKAKIKEQLSTLKQSVSVLHQTEDEIHKLHKRISNGEDLYKEFLNLTKERKNIVNDVMKLYDNLFQKSTGTEDHDILILLFMDISNDTFGTINRIINKIYLHIKDQTEKINESENLIYSEKRQAVINSNFFHKNVPSEQTYTTTVVFELEDQIEKEIATLDKTFESLYDQFEKIRTAIKIPAIKYFLEFAKKFENNDLAKQINISIQHNDFGHMSKLFEIGMLTQVSEDIMISILFDLNINLSKIRINDLFENNYLKTLIRLFQENPKLFSNSEYIIEAENAKTKEAKKRFNQKDYEELKKILSKRNITLITHKEYMQKND